MEQDNSKGKGKGEGRGKQPAEAAASDEARNRSAASFANPTYMTVGTGSTSEHASRLQAMLENDSGYGGSSTGGEDIWDPTHHADTHIPVANGGSIAERRAQAGAIHQLWYNQHRGALGRSISRVVELLKELQDFNKTWPVHYPSVPPTETRPSSRPPSQPGRSRPMSTYGEMLPAGSSPTSPTADAPPPLRRALTTADESTWAEASSAGETRASPEPRLMTPQVAQEFSILRPGQMNGRALHHEVLSSLNKDAIASMLDRKIGDSLRHLLALRERIEDTSSKVLITGDLNSGKSTFCNALLRRKVLPEDAEPCTAIFCEVLDARDNSGVEEVHAVHKDAVYRRHDETTYDVYSLQQLEEIVTDNTKYTQCKVYVKDVRAIDESLLNNGVVDIALIDAPGLNQDTTKTTAIFARQEEIDVVVFVVRAVDHFTLTAKEFIWAAAAEKAYLFIVVNHIDMVKSKENNKKKILEQLHGLSPQTFKESSELVHFVSSNRVPMAPTPPGGPGGSGSGSSSGGGGDDDPADDTKGKGKGKADPDNMRDFQSLEESLRRFVLERRARSKLAPARTYLTNILSDVNALAAVNLDMAQSDLGRISRELSELDSELVSSERAVSDAGDKAEQAIDDTVTDIFNHSRNALRTAIANAAAFTHDVPYPGLFGCFGFADDIKAAMLSHVSESVRSCEEYARSRAVSGVNLIKQLGILHGGNEFENIHFRPEVMFSKRRDVLAREVDISTEFWDFRPVLFGKSSDKMVPSMAVTAVTMATGSLIGMSTGLGNYISAAFGVAQVMSRYSARTLLIVTPAVLGMLFHGASARSGPVC
jgi:mitofusin 2